MSNTLLPCPFCGGEAELYGVPHIPKGWDFIPRCKTTSCCGRQAKKYSNRETAIAAWNLRADHLPDATKMVSNADRIRGMSDEELADFMFSMQKTIWNVLCGQLGWRESKVTDVSENGTFFIDWLQQPAKEEHHETD